MSTNIQNREIKFRVWHKEFKKFLPKEEWFLDFDGNLYFNDIVDAMSGSAGIYKCDEDEYVIQRFTGVLDENKKEIYEGDFIEGRTFHYDEKINDLVFSKIDRGHVWYINGSWNVSFNHLYSEVSCHLEKFDLYSTKIIGNIFETPEIIKE